MAKKKKQKKSKDKKKKKFGAKQVLWVGGVLLTATIFFSTTIILLIGMLPTLVAYAIDRIPGKNKTFTIGLLNIAGCFPFLLQVWQAYGDVDFALNLLSQPMTIVIIYSIAGLGYILDWVVTAGISSVLIQKSKIRLVKIEDEKKSIENRWGKEVNGKIKLNEFGFPVENQMDSEDT